jgi:hypothetical protein
MMGWKGIPTRGSIELDILGYSSKRVYPKVKVSSSDHNFIVGLMNINVVYQHFPENQEGRRLGSKA